MTIAGVSLGERSAEAARDWQDWVSLGFSTAGVLTRYDFGKRLFPITVVFNQMIYATVQSLETALQTAKIGGTIAVVPDAGDDLGCGISGSTNMVFMGYHADFVGGGYWKVVINLQYIP